MTSTGTARVTLPSDTEILIVREFHAPRHLVFRAWTTPELVWRWWHANRGEVTSIDIDLRVGGQWRYVMLTPRGQQVAFHGQYLEVIPDQRLRSTEIYEGMPEAQALSTVTFTEAQGHTTVTVLVEHERTEHRDAHIASGMEEGLQDALDLLERIAIELT